MPQLVAAFHSLVGMAAVLVGAAAFLNPTAFGIAIPPFHVPGGWTVYAPQSIAIINPVSRIEMGLGVAIGAITFSGSVIAFLKLNGNMSGKPILLPARHVINLGTLAAILLLIAYFTRDQAPWVFFTIVGLSFAIGFLLIIPIGGADMPVVISMLNSYSGWAAAAMGFTLHNSAMIITGALVGSSGAILSYIMCRAMNRSFISVIAGGFGGEAVSGAGAAAIDRPYKRGSAEDAAFLMSQADQVIIVPGYGMAVSQAQHALREMTDQLKAKGVRVKFAIHPVAGRMPGHMNVLLAEANVPYDEVFELEDINSEFAQTDVAFVIGANDVTNPAAKTDKGSPIYGMPVLDVEKARTVLFVKRSMGGVGYAGVDNELFYRDNTMMLLADAKKMVEEIVKNLG
jgi:H+-translocating NAD(P) transhydrogenase subunit beta